MCLDHFKVEGGDRIEEPVRVSKPVGMRGLVLQALSNGRRRLGHAHTPF